MADFFHTVEEIFQDWHYAHPKVLYGLIRALRPEIVVEVGTYRGYAAAYMGKAIQENNVGRLYCIDDFSLNDHVSKYGEPSVHWSDNLKKCGVRDWVTLLRGKSDEVLWPKRVDFAYLDGWHSYAMAKHDFCAAAALGAKVIVMDDTETCVGPRQWLGEVRKDAVWEVLELYADNGLAICVRKQPKKRVNFIQELPDHPGVVFHGMGVKEIEAAFAEATAVTGVKYNTKEML